jgi:DNA mismatch endonuclease (patch repair protein)
VDTISKRKRSEVMRSIRKTDTRPEVAVRRLLHAMGYRFRLYAKEVPGRPDIVFRSRRKEIFVNGCFWHQHCGCVFAREPKSNRSYWIPKLEGNRRRDRRVRRMLTTAKWSHLTIWECQTGRAKNLERKLRGYLERL